jgi:hypothetical protein
MRSLSGGETEMASWVAWWREGRKESKSIRLRQLLRGDHEITNSIEISAVPDDDDT